MKKTALLFCTILLTVFFIGFGTAKEYVYAANQSGKAGSNATWTFNESSGLLEVKGQGMMSGVSFSELSFSQKIKSVTISSGITSVNTNAFSNCKNIKSVAMASSVKSVGNYAFWNCQSLNNLSFSGNITTIGAYAFGYCQSLTTVNIPTCTTTIGRYAFINDTALKTVKISAAVTTIADGVFSGCTSISSVTGGDNVTSLGNDVFDQTKWLKDSKDTYVMFGKGFLLKYNGTATSINLPSTVKNIKAAFDGNDKIRTIKLSASVTVIDDNAFRECTALTSITYDGTVTRIGKYAFSNCTSLSAIKLKSGLKVIDTGAFAFCEKLSGISLPSSITALGDGAFMECSTLGSVIIPDNAVIGYYGANVFFDTPWYERLDSAFTVVANGWLIKYNGTSETPVLPSNVKNIADAFSYNSNIKSIRLRQGIKIIAPQAFEHCNNLEYIYIPSSVTRIYSNIFYRCMSLKKVVIMSANAKINDDMFGSTGTKAAVTGLAGSTAKTFAADNKITFYTTSTNMSEAVMTGIKDKKYTGADTLGDYVIKIGNRELRKGYDYKISIGDTVNTGECVIIVTGIGDNKGNCTFSYKITSTGSAGGNIIWKFDSKTGKLTLTGSGNMYNYSNSWNTPWYAIRDNIKIVSVGSKITAIGVNAFYGCKNLTRVWGMSDVITISSNSFRNCTSLTGVRGCTKLQNINSYAFAGDVALSALGDGMINVINVAQNAFYLCKFHL